MTRANYINYLNFIESDCLNSINYARHILDDTQKIHYFYENWEIYGKYIYYVTLSCRAESLNGLKNEELKKLRDNYLRKTGDRLIGLIEHDGSGKDFHFHGCAVTDLNYEKFKKEISKYWPGYRSEVKRPWREWENSGPLAWLLYICKPINRDKLIVKSWAGSNSNLYHCNLGKKTPWRGKPLPSQKIYRPRMPELVQNYFADNWVRKSSGKKAQFPSLSDYWKNQ